MTPAFLVTAQEHLFDDEAAMVKAGLTDSVRHRLVRLRDIYNRWLQFPLTPDKELVDYIRQIYGLQLTQAYADLRLVKALLGDFQKTTKEYHRFKFIEMAMYAYELAKKENDVAGMIKAADKYAKYTQLDKEDPIDRGFDKIAVQPFEPTDDPSVVGFKRVPNIREKIQEKIKQYWNEDVEDVSFETVEVDPFITHER